MNLLELQNTIKDTIREEARAQFEVELDQVASEVPPRTELGDLAFPVAFELAKLIKQKTGEKRAPRTIAEALKPALERIDEVARVEVAGAGYLNVFFDRARLLSELAPSIPLPASGEGSGVGLAPTRTSPPSPLRERRGANNKYDRKLMVEHTSINPNKAAHIGHVRNSVIGDTFVNILRAAGNRVEIQNYIDNTGVQVADVVVGFMHIENMSLDDIKTLDRSLTADRIVRLLLLGFVHARRAVLSRRQSGRRTESGKAEAARRNSARNRRRKQSDGGTGGLRCHAKRRMHSRHDGAAGDSLRSAGARIRDSSSAFLGARVSVDERPRRDSF